MTTIWFHNDEEKKRTYRKLRATSVIFSFFLFFGFTIIYFSFITFPMDVFLDVLLGVAAMIIVVATLPWTFFSAYRTVPLTIGLTNSKILVKYGKIDKELGDLAFETLNYNQIEKVVMWSTNGILFENVSLSFILKDGTLKSIPATTEDVGRRLVKKLEEFGIKSDFKSTTTIKLLNDFAKKRC